jgi:hypothetical protein
VPVDLPRSTHATCHVFTEGSVDLFVPAMANCFGFVVKRHNRLNVNRHNDRRLVAIVAMRIVVHPVDIQVLMERFN